MNGVSKAYAMTGWRASAMPAGPMELNQGDGRDPRPADLGRLLDRAMGRGGSPERHAGISFRRTRRSSAAAGGPWLCRCSTRPRASSARCRKARSTSIRPAKAPSARPRRRAKGHRDGRGFRLRTARESRRRGRCPRLGLRPPPKLPQSPTPPRKNRLEEACNRIQRFLAADACAEASDGFRFHSRPGPAGAVIFCHHRSCGNKTTCINSTKAAGCGEMTPQLNSLRALFILWESLYEHLHFGSRCYSSVGSFSTHWRRCFLSHSLRQFSTRLDGTRKQWLAHS